MGAGVWVRWRKEEERKEEETVGRGEGGAETRRFSVRLERLQELRRAAAEYSDVAT